VDRNVVDTKQVASQRAITRARAQGEQVKKRMDAVSLKLSAVADSMRELGDKSRTKLREASRRSRSSGVKGQEKKADIRKAKRLVTRSKKLQESLDVEVVLVRETAAALKLATSPQQRLDLIHILEAASKRAVTKWHWWKLAIVTILALVGMGVVAYALYSFPAILAGIDKIAQSFIAVSGGILKIGAGVACAVGVAALFATGFGAGAGAVLGAVCTGVLWAAGGGSPPVVPDTAPRIPQFDPFQAFY
jgi:hypothetical protein